MSLQHARRLLTAVLLGGMVVPLTAAQVSAQTGTLAGKVTDATSGRPLENVQVQVQPATGSAFGAVSGADGSYRAANLPAG